MLYRSLESGILPNDVSLFVSFFENFVVPFRFYVCHCFLRPSIPGPMSQGGSVGKSNHRADQASRRLSPGYLISLSEIPTATGTTELHAGSQTSLVAGYDTFTCVLRTSFRMFVSSWESWDRLGI